MNNELNLPPSIQICSLEAVRIADTSIYEGVITIEDSGIKNPFRVKDEYTKQQLKNFIFGIKKLLIVGAKILKINVCLNSIRKSNSMINHL